MQATTRINRSNSAEGAKHSVRRLRQILTLGAGVALLTALGGSSASASETETFAGQKSCAPGVVTVAPPAPGGYCLIMQSSLEILLGAKVYYTNATVTAGVLTSPVTLRATDEEGSTATGHCTYFLPGAYPPGHGFCVYSGGTGELAGFHANLVVGAPIGGQRVYSLTGTYWFDDDNESD